MPPQSVLNNNSISFYTDQTLATKNAGINFTANSLDLSSTVTANGSCDITNVASVQLKGSTSGTLTQKVPATTTAYTVTWPANSGSASQVLTTDGSGTLSWAVVSPAAFTWLTAALAATTGNITLSGTQTVDAIPLVAGNRVLVKNQTAGVDNGVYVVAAGAWTRATDLPAGASAASKAITVTSGTANGGAAFTCTNNAPTDIVGTDALVFQAFGSATPASGSSGSVQYAGPGSTFASATNSLFSYADAGSNVSPSTTLTVGAVSGQGNGVFQLIGSTSSLASAAGTGVQVTGGAGGNNGAGGAVTITAGAGTGSGVGGVLSLVSGDGGASGASGALSIATGAAAAAASGAVTIGSGAGVTTSGAVTLSTGASATAGSITIQPSAGSASGSSAGGNLTLATSAASGSANAGSVSITTGVGATGNGGNLTLTAGTSTGGTAGRISLVQNGVTYKWPDVPTPGSEVNQILKISTFAANVATLAWTTPSAGSPAGTNTEIQFNNSSAFGAASAVSNGRTTFSYAVGTPTANDSVLSVGGSVNSNSSPSFTLKGTDSLVAGLNGSAMSLLAGAGNTSGNGGNFAIGAGAGGASGAGGDVTVSAGASTTSTGGGVTLTGATGGTTGGSIFITCGAGGSGVGGNLSLSSGTSTSGNSGAVTIQSSAVSSGSKKSGAITIATQAGGTGSTATSGSGAITISTATSGATSSAGNITISAGAGGATSGDGGDVTLSCGLAPNGTDGTFSVVQNGITYVWPVSSTGTPPSASQVLTIGSYSGTTATLDWASGGGTPGGVNGDVQIKQGSVFSSALVASSNFSTYNFSLPTNYDGLLKVGATASSTAQQNTFTMQGQATTGAFAGTAINIVSGAGTGSNAAGALSLAGGLGGASSAGGAVSVLGGNGGTLLGDGGALTLSSGSAVSTTTGGSGGAVTLSAGIGKTTGLGGAVTVSAGVGGATAAGGALSLSSGAGGSTSGAGGAVGLVAGGSTSGNGGSVTVTAGASAAAGAGGSVSVTAGAGTAGAGGNMTLTAGNGSTAGGNVSIVAGTGTTAGTVTLKSGEAATNAGFIFQNSASTVVATVLSSAQNATSQTTGTLRVSGGAGFTQDVYAQTFNAVSDARYKKNITKLSDPLAKLMSIEGYEYEWKDDNLNSGKKQLGVLAQQLEAVGLSDIVTGTEDKKAVNYAALVPLLIEAIKELAKLTTMTSYDD